MIEPQVENELKKLVEKFEKINKVYLFGSRANGDFTNLSDIDLAFEAPKMTHEEWAEFTFVIEDELETLLQIDMVKLEDASEQLLSEINKSAKVIYSKRT